MSWIISSVSALVGMMFGLWCARGYLSARRYEDPNLHPGKWHKPSLIGTRNPRVMWERAEPVRCLLGRHDVVRCYIGPGTAHMDECVCGATRSGVYGKWLP